MQPFDFFMLPSTLVRKLKALAHKLCDRAIPMGGPLAATDPPDYVPSGDCTVDERGIHVDWFLYTFCYLPEIRCFSRLWLSHVVCSRTWHQGNVATTGSLSWISHGRCRHWQIRNINDDGRRNVGVVSSCIQGNTIHFLHRGLHASAFSGSTTRRRDKGPIPLDRLPLCGPI